MISHFFTAPFLFIREMGRGFGRGTACGMAMA